MAVNDKAIEDLSWAEYILEGYCFTEFATGDVVLDLGCGGGRQLRELRGRECRGFGLDPDWNALSILRRQHLPVFQANAEQIPVKSACLDGVVCKVVIPLTDERLAIREIGRILKHGGIAYVSYIGAGYYLRYVVKGPTWKYRVYGYRTLLNTWLYASTGRTLPGWGGDTLYQSRYRLANIYEENGLILEREDPAPMYSGYPVLLYHTLRKS